MVSQSQPKPEENGNLDEKMEEKEKTVLIYLCPTETDRCQLYHRLKTETAKEAMRGHGTLITLVWILFLPSWNAKWEQNIFFISLDGHSHEVFMRSKHEGNH